ncbi:MAG TPA: c-type cytochrome, partial [Vicinamibacterales bacterium]|nr:c-type cytochrome [Vicinamibacterales bacterium]
RDRPAAGASRWRVREIAGAALVAERGCGRCHRDDGMADPLERASRSRPRPWLETHLVDPEVIAPGIRPAPAASERELAAMLAFLGRQATGEPPPALPAADRAAAVVFARHCIGCHRLDGDGGGDGPDLSHVGRDRDAAWLRRWIADPEAVDPDAEMPAFGEKLTEAELAAISGYLARRR